MGESCHLTVPAAVGCLRTVSVSAGRPLGSTRLLRREGVAAEADYRRTGRNDGRIFTAMNIGMKDWPETVEAVRNIEEYCLALSVRPPDRYQLIPERRMGLP